MKTILGESLTKIATQNGANFILFNCANPMYIGYNTYPKSAPSNIKSKIKTQGYCKPNENVWRTNSGDYLTCNIHTNNIGSPIYQSVINQVKKQNGCKEYFEFMGHPFYNRLAKFDEPKECKPVQETKKGPNVRKFYSSDDQIYPKHYETE